MSRLRAGVERNDEVAVTFAKRGAEAGDPTGMLVYGVMYIEVTCHMSEARAGGKPGGRVHALSGDCVLSATGRARGRPALRLHELFSHHRPCRGKAGILTLAEHVAAALRSLRGGPYPATSRRPTSG